MRTALAPRASALRMSVPRRMPPSRRTSHRPCTASTTSGSASIVAGAPSSWRPPWFETMMPAMPWSRAMRASSAVMMPLSRTGSEVTERSQSMSLQLSEGSMRWPAGSARAEPVDCVDGDADGAVASGLGALDEVPADLAVRVDVELEPLGAVCCPRYFLYCRARHSAECHDRPRGGGRTRARDLGACVREPLQGDGGEENR